MRKLAIFSAAFAFAAAVYVYLFRDVRALWLAGACLLCSVLGRWWGFRRASVAGLGVAVGLLWCFGYQQLWLSGAEAANGTEQTVSVRLYDSPVQTRYGAMATGSVALSDQDYDAVLYMQPDVLELALAPGDTVTCTARIESSGLEVKDGESLYLRAKGVFLCLYASSELTVQRGKPTVPERIRIWLQTQIQELYEGETAGLVRALLTGDRSELAYGVQNYLSVAGISHAVAVSGMHVSMLMALAAFLCGRNPRLTAAVGMPVVVLFALLTGASPSACRAAVMQILLLWAPLLRRENDPPTTLGAAALVLLLENPWCIASVSFQLSFAAVAGLILLSGSIQGKMLSFRKKPGRLLRFVASGVSATLSATVTTLPLVVGYFGLISIAAPLTNLLALWAVTGIFTLGLLSCFLGPVGQLLAWTVTPLCRYVLGLCRWIAAWPYAAAYPENLPLMVWAAVFYLLALVWMLVKKKLPVRWGLCGLTAAFLLCILAGRWNYGKDQWRFTALDVGQGQCLLLQIGDYTAVIDCGGSYPEDAGEQAARLLHSAGVTRIDALILTHYDEDHAGGAMQLLERVRVDSLFLPDGEDPAGLRAALEASSGSRLFLVESLTEITVPDGQIRIYPPVSKENDNNSGICVLATAAEYDILVTGDLDQFAEMRLLAAWELPQVELLVAGHHGAADAVSQVLLDTVGPETVVISVGAENAYGHPAEQTLARIHASGAELLRTDLLGTIVIAP